MQRKILSLPASEQTAKIAAILIKAKEDYMAKKPVKKRGKGKGC